MALFFRVRTSPIKSFCHIAVMAQHLESFWKIIFNKPKIKRIPNFCNFSPVVCSTPIDMIYAKKFINCFFAARADSFSFRIMTYNLFTNLSIVKFIFNNYLFFMCVPKLFLSFKFFVTMESIMLIRGSPHLLPVFIRPLFKVDIPARFTPRNEAI